MGVCVTWMNQQMDAQLWMGEMGKMGGWIYEWVGAWMDL